MSRNISLAARKEMNKPATGATPITLVVIEHEDLEEPVRLSADYTETLSVEPLMFGTVSNGQTYRFALMSANLPDDQEGSPPRTTIVFENVDQDQVAVLRSMSPFKVATVSLYVVMASSPDAIEVEFTGLNGGRVDYDAGQITMEISREPVASEPWPCDRMTKARFPGLHR